MIKPILIIKMPDNIRDYPENVEHHMSALEKIGRWLEPDYYVLNTIGNNTEVEFQLLAVNDIDEMKYEELKQMIKDKLDEITPNKDLV